MHFIPAVAALLAAGLVASCNQTDAAPVAPDTRSGAWRPIPVEDAAEPSDLLILDLADGGRVAIELAPEFAPVHVANIRALARAGWWNGAAIYRVQDNYVVQWGLNESDRPLPAGVVAKPPAEYHRPLAGLDIRPLGYPDSYAPMVGQHGEAAG